MPETIRALRAVLDEAPVALVLLEQDGRIAWENATFARWSGRPAEPEGGAGSPDPLGLLRATPVLPALRRALEGGGAEGLPWREDGVPLPGRGPDGPTYVDVTLSAVPPVDGRPARLILVLVDASSQAREHQLARLHYEAFLTSSNAIEVTDRDGTLIDVNPAFERTYGYSRAECVGRKPNLVRSRKTDPQLYTRMWAELTDPALGHWSGELVNRDRWGRERPVFLTITAVKDDRGTTTHYVGVAVDLTEHKTWERVAVHSDRLASLGQLAAGVAHEINTPLANIMLVSESLRRRASDPWTRGRAETIASQVEVAARIVRGLLDFSRRSEPQTSRVDLSDIARESVRFLRGKQPVDVEVDERYPARPLPILGDRNQLMQVLTNLLLNAYDAVETSREKRIVLEVRAGERGAEVEVRDSGPGIPLEALPHVFEPFFTTKPEGRGTGLGLAICHGIVQAHGGTIVARNQRDGGASLLITFPLATELPTSVA